MYTSPLTFFTCAFFLLGLNCTGFIIGPGGGGGGGGGGGAEGGGGGRGGGSGVTNGKADPPCIVLVGSAVLQCG